MEYSEIVRLILEGSPAVISAGVVFALIQGLRTIASIYKAATETLAESNDDLRKDLQDRTERIKRLEIHAEENKELIERVCGLEDKLKETQRQMADKDTEIKDLRKQLAALQSKFEAEIVSREERNKVLAELASIIKQVKNIKDSDVQGKLLDTIAGLLETLAKTSETEDVKKLQKQVADLKSQLG